MTLLTRLGNVRPCNLRSAFPFILRLFLRTQQIPVKCVERMMIEVLQRFTWNGTPKEISDLFRVTKNRRKARAVIFSHQFGWEVRLLVGSQEELVSSQCAEHRTKYSARASNGKPP